MPNQPESSLVVGCSVDHALDPRIDGDGNAERVLIPTQSIAKHTAIVAQSGSGKSFFLGRLIEEIVLHTKAKCMVLDPNGDFVKIGEQKDTDPSNWTPNAYDRSQRKGPITFESAFDEFAQAWQRVNMQVNLGPGLPDRLNSSTLCLNWTDVSAKLIAADYDRSLQHEVINCHRVLQALGRLFYSKLLVEPEPEPIDLIEQAERLLLPGGSREQPDYISVIDRKFESESLARKLAERVASKERDRSISNKELDYLMIPIRHQLDFDKKSVIELAKDISASSSSYYFRKSRSLVINPVFTKYLDPMPERPTSEVYQLEVNDLSSLMDREVRRLAINAIMRREWNHAVSSWRREMAREEGDDRRVPTFIVVDEAHNAIPLEPRDAADWTLREQFRTFAAEGRKYGLFLIIVSQRPDKLDPLVLSECENKVIMRIGSESVLNTTVELLGLEDIPTKSINRVLDFQTGRGILAGNWITDTHCFFYSAARRTAEGGKGLSAKWWAEPYDDGRGSALESDPPTENAITRYDDPVSKSATQEKTSKKKRGRGRKGLSNPNRKGRS